MTDETAGSPEARDKHRKGNPEGPTTVSTETSVPLPQKIANYRIVRKLAEGGMGVVYEAEQQNPHRPVALKVIRGGSYVDDHAVKLFQREAQTLARLKHPSIAAIYEAGRTEDGQHFFAMELVRGVPLGDYLRSQPLPVTGGRTEIRARLQIFLRICDAISYAHQRGVIHRDLKPSNILILPATGAGGSSDPAAEVQVKILDFGLARLTDADVTLTTCVSELGHVAGTLPYTSPEQARGNPDEIDVRSDVYSLGILLYEMLTGQLPYKVEHVMLHEALRVIQEASPRRPSALRGVLRGDVETVTLKALEKEPARRYQSSASLAEDVRHLLGDQPILARAPSAGYQLRKMIHRHKGAFAFLATLLVLLTSFGVTMSVMFERQRRARAAAVLEARKVERINQFLQDMLVSVDPEYARGRDVMVREILDDASTRTEKELSDQPEIQAALQSAIGRAYLSLGLFDAAEKNLKASLETRRRVFPGDSPELAAGLYDLGCLHSEKAEHEKVVPLIRESLRIRQAVFQNDSKDVADAKELLGLALARLRQYDSAESLFQEALATRRKLFGDNDPEGATALANIADVRFRQNRLAEAESLHREALTRTLMHFGENSIWTSKTLNNMAITLGRERKYAEAESVYRRALAITRKIRGDDHPNTAVNIYNIARLYMDQGRPDEAEPLLRESLAINRKRFGEENPQTVTNLNSLGMCLEDLGAFTEAEQVHRETLSVVRRVYGPEHAEVAQSLDDIGLCLRYQGKYSDAEPFYREAVAMRRKLTGEDHIDVTTSRLGLATVLVGLGRTVEADSILQWCLAIRRKVLPAGHWRIRFAESALGNCRTAQGRFGEAESLLVGSHESLEAASEPLPIRHRREILRNIIRMYESRGRPRQAEPYRSELRLLESSLAPRSLRLSSGR